MLETYYINYSIFYNNLLALMYWPASYNDSSKISFLYKIL